MNRPLNTGQLSTLQKGASAEGRHKRLAVFLDGTWNAAGDNTNVWRLYLMLAAQGADGTAQLGYYDEGVGTRWYDRLTGGMFGAGLSANICAAYQWLMEHYDPGDEIYIFGFSRGAFTARSLAGLIARCGLLKPTAPLSFLQLFERYQKGDAVDPIYQLRHRRSQGETKFDFEERVLLDHAHYHRNLIKLLGVWDTVGTLGVPFGNFKGVSRRTLRFHNTHLSRTVQHSYHAVAIDEHRKPYWAVMWTTFLPETSDGTPEEPEADDRHIEQRWFSGAHANVGGGYRDDLLPERPLAWLQGRAVAAGLAFRDLIACRDDTDLAMLPCDSYGEFLFGWWKRIPRMKRYVRWVMSDPVRKTARARDGRPAKPGWVFSVNERIDLSVIQRCRLDANYRPLSLVEWAKRKQLALDDVIARPEDYAGFWAPVEQAGIEIPQQAGDRGPPPPASVA